MLGAIRTAVCPDEFLVLCIRNKGCGSMESPDAKKRMLVLHVCVVLFESIQFRLKA